MLAAENEIKEYLERAREEAKAIERNLACEDSGKEGRRIALLCTISEIDINLDSSPAESGHTSNFALVTRRC